MAANPFPSLPVRRCADGALAVIVLVATVGIAAANFYLFSDPKSIIWDWHFATGGWVNANLTLFLPLSLLTIAIALILGGLRWKDIGLSGGFASRLVLFLVLGWGAIQSITAAASLFSGNGLALHPAWSEPGAGTVIGLLIAMVLGTALFEDMVFRAIFYPQFYLRLKDRFAGHAKATIATLAITAVIFSLWHLPTLLLNRGDPEPMTIMAGLAYMLLGGVMLAMVFIRTGSLAIAMACHALVNAPTLLFASPVSGSLIAGIFGLAVILAGPLCLGERWSAAVIVPLEQRQKS